MSAAELREAAREIRIDWPDRPFMLAVADWLTSHADDSDDMCERTDRSGGCAALAVARAYLGAEVTA